MKISKLVCTLLLIALITFVGCVPGDGKHTARETRRIFLGHLARMDRANIANLGIFNPEIRVYEPENTGWWYDFGFYIAIISGFGGISLSRRKRKKVIVQENSNPE